MTLGIAVVLAGAAGLLGLIIGSIRAPHSWTSTHEESRRRRNGFLLLFWAFGAFVLAILGLVVFEVIDALR